MAGWGSGLALSAEKRKHLPCRSLISLQPGGENGGRDPRLCRKCWMKQELRHEDGQAVSEAWLRIAPVAGRPRGRLTIVRRRPPGDPSHLPAWTMAGL